MRENIIENIVRECARQHDSCLYTSTALFILLKRAHLWRTLFVVAPIILGSFASWSFLNEVANPWIEWGTAVCAFLAGIFPAIFVALNLNMQIQEIQNSATEFKNLQDRFRQAAKIKRFSESDELEAHFEDLMDRMDGARGRSVPIPEWCFKQAQKKISKGDYSFDVDSSNGASAP